MPACAACGEPLSMPFAMREHPCRHIAHAWCYERGCAVCRPPEAPSRLRRALGFVLDLTWYGVMGEAHARNGERRRSVMMASTLGFLWALQPAALLLRPLGLDAEPAFFFALFVWLYRRWLGTTLAAALALWVSGQLNALSDAYAHPAAYALDVLACAALTAGFRYSDVSGSLAVFCVVFAKVWRRPSMWDLHAGNCCGAWSVFAGVLFASLVAASAAAGLVHETFDAVGPLHAWLVARLVFGRQARDPFSALAARRIREAFWVLFFVVVVLGHHRT